MSEDTQPVQPLESLCRDALVEQTAQLIDTQWPALWQQYASALGEWCAENPAASLSKFKFSFSMSLSVHPVDGTTTETEARLTFSERHVAKATPVRVDNHPRLPGMEG